MGGIVNKYRSLMLAHILKKKVKSVLIGSNTVIKVSAKLSMSLSKHKGSHVKMEYYRINDKTP